MSFPMGALMTPKHQMIDPNTPIIPRNSISSATLKDDSPVQANMKAKVTTDKKLTDKGKQKAEGNDEVKFTITRKWTAKQIAELANSRVGKMYDQPGFVTDPGIEKYIASRIFDQYTGRFEHPEGSALVQADRKQTKAEALATSDTDYERLSSTSSQFSFVEGEEAITVQKQRLPRDSYHKIVNDLATGTSSNISDLNSSATPSIAQADDYSAFLARAYARDAVDHNLIMSREEAANLIMSSGDSRDIQIAFIPRDDSSLQLIATSSTPAPQTQGSAARPSSMLSFGSRIATSQSLETIPERYKLKGITIDGKKYYVRDEHSVTPDSLSVKTRNSFANMTIQELVQQHPQLQSELEALKKSIDEHDRDLRQGGIIGQKHLQHQNNEMLAVMHKQGEKAAQAADIIERSYRQTEAAEAKVEAMKKQLTQSETTRDAWEHEFKMKARELDAQGRQYTNKLVNLEREKRALVEKNRYLEERLETERIRANGAEHSKDVAMATSDGMRKHFDFYRNYYEAQAGLYGQYFGAETKTRSKSPKGKQMEAIQVAVEGKENESRDGAVKQATDILRERYREMLEKPDVAEPLRGFEFLAYLENGGAVAGGAAEATEKEQDNDEDYESDERSEAAAEAQSTFISNFLGVKH